MCGVHILVSPCAVAWLCAQRCLLAGSVFRALHVVGRAPRWLYSGCLRGGEAADWKDGCTHALTMAGAQCCAWLYINSGGGLKLSRQSSTQVLARPAMIWGRDFLTNRLVCCTPVCTLPQQQQPHLASHVAAAAPRYDFSTLLHMWSLLCALKPLDGLPGLVASVNQKVTAVPQLFARSKLSYSVFSRACMSFSRGDDGALLFATVGGLSVWRVRGSC